MIVGPFSIKKDLGWVECECPDNLCPHMDRTDGHQGMRSYPCWVVWDTRQGDTAFRTCPGYFRREYKRRQDAKAAAQDYLAQVPA